MNRYGSCEVCGRMPTENGLCSKHRQTTKPTIDEYIAQLRNKEQ